MADWSEVARGWVIQDRKGVNWTVVAVAGPVITISAPGRGEHTLERSGPVTVVSRPAPSEDLEVTRAVAMGIVATKFGGIEIGKRAKDRVGGHVCPIDYTDPASLHAHLHVFHGHKSDDPSLKGLRREHAERHRPDHRNLPAYEQHVHDPDYESL